MGTRRGSGAHQEGGGSVGSPSAVNDDSCEVVHPVWIYSRVRLVGERGERGVGEAGGVTRALTVLKSFSSKGKATR